MKYDLTPRKDPLAQPLQEEEFLKRFKRRFKDPIYNDYEKTIEELSRLAWKAHQENHKSPITQKAGVEFQNPDYDLSVEWYQAREAIRNAQYLHESYTTPNQILLISAADRNDQSCPGEVSKSKRLLKVALDTFQKMENVEVQILDLSQMISEYGKHIYPCKACVSTSMALCHWPCSCYPNYAVDQMHDWMNEIYPMWVKAHGIMIITPVYWYQAPSALKLMMDRLVCADGGNPDPTSTEGKNPEMAKKIEMNGWHYPRHLAGRNYSVYVHGDAEGADFLKSALNNWLSDMHLIPATHQSTLARYVGYLKEYAISHLELDHETEVKKEIELMAQSLVESVKANRVGKMKSFLPEAEEPRAK